jgi:hypothetical protein
MKKILQSLVFVLVIIILSLQSFSQKAPVKSGKIFRVGIFAPLYLDSIFNAEGKLKNNLELPRFVKPSIDFINGAKIALDSLVMPNQLVNTHIYDTKSKLLPLDQLIKLKKIDSLDLIIGSVKDVEFKQLASLALSKNIPFISSTYPNDGGVTANPFLVIINSTLKSHCEAIYANILQNHGKEKILLIRKKGAQEDIIASYFKAMNEADLKPKLNIQTIILDSIFSTASLQKKLDSTHQSIIIGASLDENFSSKLTAACYELHQYYPITLIGMPNWDGFRVFTKKDLYADFPVYFTSPYYNARWDNNSKLLIAGYGEKYKGKPSDMVFKGFESTQRFIKLLIAFPNDFLSHLNDTPYKVFSEYNFRPVFLNKENKVPDYFENKHLYFIKILNGATTRAIQF